MNHQECMFLTLVLILLSKTNAKPPEVSPCPRLFTYEPRSPQPDRWYGIITLLSDSQLTGIWLRVIFDKPILQLGNWFGEVQKKSAADYLIKNPQFKLPAHTTKSVRFFVRYNVNEPPPQLTEFRINAKTVCPEDLVTTTPSTTTEQLFTSSDEEFPVSVRTEQKTSMVSISTSTLPSVGADQFFGVDKYQGMFSGVTEHSAVNENVGSACGTTKIQSHNRGKLTKQVAHKGEFPWHASMYYTGITITYLCGASLISQYHLITVAHCMVLSRSLTIIDPERLVVYLGKHYVKHSTHHEGMQTHFVSDIIAHPAYNAQTYSNDVALLKLLEPVDFTDIVRPVCLWQGPTDFGYVANRPGTIVGWGFDKTGKIKDELMFVQMTIQDLDVCYQSPISNYLTRFSSRNSYCANFVDDTMDCVGDSGGGMVFPSAANNTKLVWHLRGLVSISVVLQRQLKCDRYHYVVFTDVAKHLDWIKETMKQ